MRATCPANLSLIDLATLVIHTTDKIKSKSKGKVIPMLK
jgi:hypothetical protein